MSLNRSSNKYGIFIIQFISIKQFIPIKDKVKLYVVDISNKLNKNQNVSINYFVKPILGSRSDDNKYVLTEKVDNKNVIKFKNVINLNYKDVAAFIS